MRLNRAAASILGMTILATSCSGGASERSVISNATSTTPETTLATDAPTTKSTTSTATTTTTEPATAPDPAGATSAWLAMWDGVEMVVTDPIAAEQAVTQVATAAVFAQLNTIYNPSVDSGVGNSTRTFDNNPTATQQDDGSVLIQDCMFETPKIGNATILYSGTVLETDGIWKVESVSLTSEIGCVPSAVEQAVIDGYEAYWDARVSFWDPANPDDPLVEETVTGRQLDLLQKLLADHAARGLALRGRAEDHPEVIEVRSPTEVVILDCKFQDPGRGLFVTATGDRLPDIAPVRDGQRDLTSAVMVAVDGVWKVSDIQGQADVSCDTAPTSQGLPVV